MQSFQIIKPRPELSPYIRHYWILKDDSEDTVSERTLPVGAVQLIFHKAKQLLISNGNAPLPSASNSVQPNPFTLQPVSFISGQSFSFSDVRSTGRIEMITVVFHPYAAKALLHIPLHLFHGQNVATNETSDCELSDLGKRIADTPDNELCIRLIEQFFLHRLYRFSDYNLKRMSPVLQEINLHPLTDVTQLAGVACLSNKQFGRVFADYVGTSPKEYLRIVRMQRALYRLQQDATLSFAQVAYECGFSDQSHMIREFRLFSGYTPAGYLAVCTPYSDYFSES